MPSPSAPRDTDDALTQHRNACYQLGNLQDELLHMEAAILQQRAGTFHRLNDGTRNITTLQREVDMAVVDVQVEALKLQGEVRQVEARVRWLETWLTVKSPSTQAK